jgi:acetyl esterase/lipase
MRAGVSPQNVIMGGDSAGGNLVASLMLLIRQMRLEVELKIMQGTKLPVRSLISNYFFFGNARKY